VDISGDISKRITEDFGISIGEGWSQIRQPGGPTLAGFANLETAFQYQLLKDGSHELAMLLGLVVEWGGSRRKSPFRSLRSSSRLSAQCK
jgi:hypothetical protein